MKRPCSPFDQLHGVIYLPRLLDKIRLNLTGELPEDYLANLGHPEKMDGLCLRFLGISYESLCLKIREGASNEEIWEWILHHGKKHTEEEIHLWNTYMRKYGWNDRASEILKRRLREGGYEDRSDIQTIFDYIDLDERREKNCSFTQ